ncbi:MAG: hypothetical protein WD472_08145 [Dehalococcoidia bacterium]
MEEGQGSDAGGLRIGLQLYGGSADGQIRDDAQQWDAVREPNDATDGCGIPLVLPQAVQTSS